MSAHALKTRHVGYGCACVIHNFSCNQRIERLARADRTQVPSLPPPSCHKPRKDGMMPPSFCVCLVKTRCLIVDVVGERIDAETCDGFEAGEN